MTWNFIVYLFYFYFRAVERVQYSVLYTYGILPNM